MAFYGMLKLQFTSNLPLTPPVQSEASAAWAHRRRKQLPAAVARACRVPGAELWVTRRQLAEDAVWWDGMGSSWLQNKYGFRCQWEPFLELRWNNGNIFCMFVGMSLIIVHCLGWWYYIRVYWPLLEFTSGWDTDLVETSPKDGFSMEKKQRNQGWDGNLRSSGGNLQIHTSLVQPWRYITVKWYIPPSGWWSLPFLMVEAWHTSL